MAEQLMNGGSTSSYRWGQTLDEVTVQIQLPVGVRARDLSVTLQRDRLRVTPKAASAGDGASVPTLEGSLAQPICCDESTWMIEDGVLVLRLAKDNLRAENSGPSTEWWNGLLAGEDTIDTAAVSVGDYVKTSQLRPEQLADINGVHAEQQALHREADAVRQAAAAAEANLPSEKRLALEKLRESFPDIPIEWGNTGDGVPTT